MRHPGLRSPKVLLAGVLLSAAYYGVCVLSATAQSGPVSCKPVSERQGEIGCWILSSGAWSGVQSGPVYWSLDTFPSEATANVAKGEHGQVLRALNQVWVLTISSKDDRPATGHHVAQIGPLPLKEHHGYAAQYMEAVLTPGMDEAFYTEAGESCLETPEGKQIGRPGTGVIVPEGAPMMLTASGTENRRSLALVLHDSAHPWSARADDWKPKGLCHE